MRLNTEENLQRFLTNSKSSNYQKLITNTTPNYIPNTNSINASSIVYTQSKSNKNISKKDNQNQNKRFTPFFNLNSRQKEKLNISKFFKSKKNYYNNINLITEQNNQKKITKKEELNISIPSKSCKKNNYKTLNYEQTSYGRIMKYFTVKSNNKPMKFDEVSQVFVPIRNTLSNEHRNKNLKKNKKKDENVRDKINYLLNSKDKIIQIFKDNKLQKKIGNKKSSSNNKKEDSNKSKNKIINKEETRIENDINYNNLKTIDNNNNEENIHKNSLKKSNQYRIRKINLPSGINLASIQSNNKLLHNLLNKKSKKIHKNSNDRIQTDYNINKNIK